MIENLLFELNFEHFSRKGYQGANLQIIDHDVQTWFGIRSNLKLIVKDGRIEIFSNDGLFMRHTDSSIKKADLSYMLVSGGWGASGFWTITGKRNGGKQ